MKPLMSPLRGSTFSMLIATWNDRFSRALFYSYSSLINFCLFWDTTISCLVPLIVCLGSKSLQSCLTV